ncbi:MAG: PAAR-like domain-containing protein [Pseudomonadota bacterium]
MANETVTKSKRFYCVSLLPDICKTPIGPSTPPIPYSIVGEFVDATDVSPNVKSRSDPVILHQRSIIPTVKGDEPGTAGGIKSGTFGKRVETKTASKTYFGNNAATVQEGCEVWMNNRNTIGKIYERGGIAPRTRLQQINATLAESIADTTADARVALKSTAQDYKDKQSAALHEFAASTAEKGGKILASSAALGGAGVVVGATGIGAPVALVMESGAATGATIGSTVTAVGTATEVTAKVLDYTADYVLTGKTPDLITAALDVGKGVAESFVLSKLGSLRSWFGDKIRSAGKTFLGKLTPGKKSGIPPPPPPRPPDKPPGGKTSQPKKEKADKPSDCCPKNAAPAGKKVSSRHPVHFGTGEEVLYQTDFVLDEPEPLAWTRCYRSGSEHEDWSMCGARWSTPFTASLALASKGIVYVDDSGRAVRLARLAVGDSLDNRKEGFTLARSSATEFLLTWRDGSTDTFVRDAYDTGVDSWLPHGFDGLNAMRAPGEPARIERFRLTRSAARDGRGISIERYPQARPGEVLLRVRSDGGRVLEAMRDEDKQKPDQQTTGQDGAEAPRIGRVEEVRADGNRICHVRYTFQRGAASFNLARQSNLLGDARFYTYQHHLLSTYSTYSGFRHGLKWVSLAALRESWQQSVPLDDALMACFPITRDNSYQARAVATTTGDGKDQVAIDYLDMDTTRVTDANGGVLDFTFDANWLAVNVRRVEARGASSLGKRSWDKDGMLLAETDANGHSTRYEYDAAGNMVASTDALGHTGRIEYNTENQPVAFTDALGHTMRLDYNSDDRLSTRTDALGHVTKYRYDSQGRLAELIDAKGGSKHLRYDSIGQLRDYTDCSGSSTSFEFDANGRLVTVADDHQNTTRYGYDGLGRMVSSTTPDGVQEYFAYDADGQMLGHMDGAGHRTSYHYNGHGLPTEHVDALGQSVRYAYDDMLQLVELINANGESYHFSYDAEGRIASETGFDGKTTSYNYDGAGHLSASECRGQRTDLVRDLIGQLLAKQTADGMHRYAYDPLGRMTAVAAPHAEQRFAYDPLGQLIEERNAYYLTPAETPNAAQVSDASFVMSHAYDELGNRSQTILPNGRRIDIQRYGSGHWHGTLWQGTTVVAIERDSLHLERLRRFGPDGKTLKQEREYDPQSRLIGMTIQRHTGSEAKPLRQRQFKYDKGGNLLAIKHGSSIAHDRLGTHRYSYDPIGQLLTATQPGINERFAYDPAGNLLDIPEPSSPDNIHQFDEPRPGAALPVKVDHNLLKHYQGYVYDYDEQGNVASMRYEPAGATGHDTVLKYDAENRLIHAIRNVSLTRDTACYFYDAYSRRIAKQVTTERWKYNKQKGLDAPAHCECKMTLFVWDGDVMVQEVDADKTITYLYDADSFVPMARIESEGGSGIGGKVDERCAAQLAIGNEVDLWLVEEWHTRGKLDNKAQTAGLAAAARHDETWRYRQQDAEGVVVNDCISYYNCDHLGTPRELLDDQGKAIWSAIYKAWGQMVDQDRYGSAPPDPPLKIHQPLRFQGQYEDTETWHHYNRHRYYDPKNGRYTTQDPIGILGGQNAYLYAPNATIWSDPLGLSKTCPTHPTCDPCANLPQHIIDTFAGGKTVGRRLINDEKFYKYHGNGNRTGRKYSWLTNKNYNTETGLRRALAIRHDWGVKISKMSEFTIPTGTWICEGKAASQGKGYSGKGYQAVVTNIPRAWTNKTDRVF